MAIVEQFHLHIVIVEGQSGFQVVVAGLHFIDKAVCNRVAQDEFPVFLAKTGRHGPVELVQV
jgi:hypothetical protein